MGFDQQVEEIALYCLDASVFVNSLITRELHAAESKRLLERIRERLVTVTVPELIIPEVASAIERGTRDAKAAMECAKTLRALPRFVFVPVDALLADRAASLAAQFHLRGSDAVYVATALMASARLITLDRQQRLQAAQCIEARTPAEELAWMERVT